MAISKKTWRRLAFSGLLLALAGGGVYWYVATEKFSDTGKRKAHYNVQAQEFIREFERDNESANFKYADKIVAVSGRIAEVEQADTSVNVKFIDSASGSYVIFAFQDQHIAEARSLKEGDEVSIKGSFSSGLFSEILGTTFITFKRSALNK